MTMEEPNLEALSDPKARKVIDLNTGRVGAIEWTLTSNPPQYRIRWYNGDLGNLLCDQVRVIPNYTFDLITGMYRNADEEKVSATLRGYLVFLACELVKYEGLKTRLRATFDIDN